MCFEVKQLRLRQAECLVSCLPRNHNDSWTCTRAAAESHLPEGRSIHMHYYRLDAYWTALTLLFVQFMFTQYMIDD